MTLSRVLRKWLCFPCTTALREGNKRKQRGGFHPRSVVLLFSRAALVFLGLLYLLPVVFWSVADPEAMRLCVRRALLIRSVRQ